MDKGTTFKKSVYFEVSEQSARFQYIKKRFNELVGQRNEKINQLESTKQIRSDLEIRFDNSQKSLEIVKNVARNTQQKLEYHISNLVTMALASVFPDPYEFGMEFVERRNKIECDLYFVKKGDKDDPFSSGAGGELDIASFALRCAFWSLKKTRPVMILDEPFKNVSVDLQNKCSEMLKYISDKLKIQIIMISHLPNIINSADKIYRVNKVNGISEVIEE